MKGNKKILVIAILLLLIAVSYGTYAIYKTSQTATGSVSAAAWQIQFKNGQTVLQDRATITFTGADCTNDHVVEGKIAPGATCTKTITLDATGSEVDVKYEVRADNDGILVNGQAQPANSNAFSADVDDQLDGVILIATNSSDTSEDITVTLSWDGEEGTSYDPGDTEMVGATITVPLTLTAKQYVGS